MTAESKYARFGSGKSVPRVEDEALLTGAGRFADDFSVPGQAYVCFLRSPHAHARIGTIDSRAAAGMPGVIAIVTGEDLVRDNVSPLPLSADFKRADGSPTASPPRHALAVGTVRFVGEAVAAVIAQSVQQARDAVEAIDIGYDPLPAVTDAAAAVSAGAPQVWPAASGNVACEARHGDATATDAAFARAAHRVSLDLVNQRVAPVRSSRAPCSRATTRRPSGSRCASVARRRPDCATTSARSCWAFLPTRCGCWSATSAAASA